MEMDMDMEIVDNNDVEVPIDPQHKRQKTSLSTEFQHTSGDTSSLNSFFISEGKTLLEQSGSLSVSDHGSSEGKSVITTVSIECDDIKSDGSETKSDESDASSPPMFNGDEESDDDECPPLVPHAQTYRVVTLGLEYYNAKNKGAEYEYVSLVKGIPVFLGDGFGSHANFFARSKSDNTSDPKLFFVEEVFSPPDITRCEILDPQPFSLGETAPESAYGSDIFHPKGVICACRLNPRFKEGKAYSSSLMFHNYRKSLEAAAASAS